MPNIETNIYIGLGDIINTKAQLEPFKDKFDQIKVSYDQSIINTYRAGNQDYLRFLEEIGRFFFSDPPFVLNVGQFKARGIQELCRDYNLPLIKPNLKDYLCRGALLNVGEYFVMNTKIRTFHRSKYNKIKNHLWETVKKLSRKYRAVILGEKKIEESFEYKGYGPDNVYSIYSDILANIDPDRLVDLTVPALGITAPNLAHVRQDCMTMSEAKFVITIGIGGAYCMSIAAGNVIGYRDDNDGLADALFDNKPYPDALITKHWNEFVGKLESYL